MQVALEISYHNIDDAQAADEAIRAHVEQLEESYDRLASCRVRVAQRAHNDNRTKAAAVRIELGIAGQRDVVVALDPDRPPRTHQPGVSNAIHEAFRMAEQALQDLKRIREENTRIAAQGDLSFLGQIAEVYPLQDYGYLLNKDGALLYFHREAIVEGDFDYLVRGAEAYYVEEDGSSGPLASKVWVREASQ